jgi:hypothetical protein
VPLRALSIDDVSGHALMPMGFELRSSNPLSRSSSLVASALVILRSISSRFSNYAGRSRQRSWQGCGRLVFSLHVQSDPPRSLRLHLLPGRDLLERQRQARPRSIRVDPSRSESIRVDPTCMHAVMHANTHTRRSGRRWPLDPSLRMDFV